MKKIFLPLVTILLTISCSTDDLETDGSSQSPNDSETNDQSSGSGLFRFSEVDTVNDEITISNLGDGNLEVGDYFLCLGPGTYRQVSALTSESTLLTPGGSIILSYDVDQAQGGLSVFTTNEFASASPSVLLDYIQWGAPNQARVDQAVTAGRWDDANNLAPGVEVFSFDGTSTQFGSAFWTGNTPPPPVDGVLRVLQVRPNADEVILTNLGNTTIDAGSYWFCLGPGTYARVSNLVSGDTTLNRGETLTVSYDVNPSEDGLSVFATNTFGSSDPDILLDYVQWGAGNQARVNQAVTAGRWDSAANFVPTAAQLEFTGEASDFGSVFWE